MYRTGTRPLRSTLHELSQESTSNCDASFSHVLQSRRSQILEVVFRRNKCRKRIFCTRGSSVGFNSMRGSEKCEISKPSFRAAFPHGSRMLRILARVSQPRYGHPLPRKVCACEALSCWEKIVLVVDRETLRLLTEAPLIGGPFCRSLRCVVCISETAYFCASMPAHCFLYLLISMFSYQVFGRSLHSPTLLPFQ